MGRNQGIGSDCSLAVWDDGACGKFNLNSPIVNAKCQGGIEVNERCALRVANSGQNMGWSLRGAFIGLVSHDGSHICWTWDNRQACWIPIRESSGAFSTSESASPIA
jgi:hypothetical protein